MESMIIDLEAFERKKLLAKELQGAVVCNLKNKTKHKTTMELSKLEDGYFSICLKAQMCYQSLQRFPPLRGLKISIACEMMVQSNCWKTGGYEEVEDWTLICLVGSVDIYMCLYMYVFLSVEEACSP